MITGDEMDEDWGMAEARYRLLEEVLDEEVNPFDCSSPFSKDELSTIAEEVEKADKPWGPIGSESTDSASEREYEEPDADSVRYQVLQSLQEHGPATAGELASQSHVRRSSIESELPRLHRHVLAGRSKRPSFEDVYTYWVTPLGLKLIEDREAAFTLEQVRAADDHRDLHHRYGVEEEDTSLEA